MSDPTLYIANKTYSSWSLRAWIALTVKGVAFREILVPLDDAAGNVQFRAFSPSGKVPTLVHGDLTVWESLAILEYLAERFPEAGFWPAEGAARAVARAVSSEMASGFMALRAQCPMNMRRQPAALRLDDDKARAVAKDVGRIETLWDTCLQASGGPFLFGPSFCAADAMYAPVVNRFAVYELSENAVARTYMETIEALPAWQEWLAGAKAESWIVEADEV